MSLMITRPLRAECARSDRRAVVISILSLGLRKCHGKQGPTVAPVGGRRFAAVEFDQVLDDGKAEAGAAGARPRLVDAVEALEHAPEILRWNTRTGVGNADGVKGVPDRRGERDARPFGRVVDGVFDQIP